MGTRRKRLPGLNVILTRVRPRRARYHSQGRLCRPWIEGRKLPPATPHPFGGRYWWASNSFQGQNAPGYQDRDPSGVKQKNLSLATGPQIGNVFLARSLLLTIHVGHFLGLAQHLERLVHEFFQLIDLSGVRQRLGAFHEFAHRARVLAALVPALNPPRTRLIFA